MPKRKVIIVDDDRDTREMLTLALELEGYDVTQAANGLRLISSLHVDQPDLIILDVMMSWIDGFGEDHRQGMEAGATDYFTKPVAVERLMARVRELIGGPERP
jgi:DNA-binding response OmpR family regulator